MADGLRGPAALQSACKNPLLGHCGAGLGLERAISESSTVHYCLAGSDPIRTIVMVVVMVSLPSGIPGAVLTSSSSWGKGLIWIEILEHGR